MYNSAISIIVHVFLTNILFTDKICSQHALTRTDKRMSGSNCGNQGAHLCNIVTIFRKEKKLATFTSLGILFN